MAGFNFTTQTQAFPTGNSPILSGGLNSTGGSLALNDSESSDLQNIEFTRFGSIVKRTGYLHINSTALGDKSDGLEWYEYESSGSIIRKLVNVCDSKLYKMDNLDGTWDDITGSVTITAGNHCDFEVWDNIIFVTNGVDAPFQWNGSGNASASSIPTNLTSAKFVKQFNNYLFYANVVVDGTAWKTRIYFSNIQDPTTWQDSNFLEIGFNDGQEITGLRVLGDRLVIYKSRCIYNLYFTGDSDIPFYLPGGGKSNSNVGCIAPFSIQEVENGHVFLAHDGLYYYDGLNSSKLSNKIINTLFGFNTTQFDKAVSVVYRTKNRYLISFCSPSQTEADRVVVWDYYLNNFSVYVGWNPSAMCSVFSNGFTEQPYFADYAGYTYKTDIGYNDYPLKVKTAINAYYYTNWRTYGDYCDKKGIPHVYIYYQTSNSVMTFAYSYDFEYSDQYTQTFSTSTGVALYDTAIYGTDVYGGQGGSSIRRDLTGRGRVVRFKIANNAVDETFTVDGIGSSAYLETNV